MSCVAPPPPWNVHCPPTSPQRKYFAPATAEDIKRGRPPAGRLPKQPQPSADQTPQILTDIANPAAGGAATLVTGPFPGPTLVNYAILSYTVVTGSSGQTSTFIAWLSETATADAAPTPADQELTRNAQDYTTSIAEVNILLGAHIPWNRNPLYVKVRFTAGAAAAHAVTLLVSAGGPIPALQPPSDNTYTTPPGPPSPITAECPGLALAPQYLLDRIAGKPRVPNPPLAPTGSCTWRTAPDRIQIIFPNGLGEDMAG